MSTGEPDMGTLREWCATEPDADALLEACDMAATGGVVSRDILTRLMSKLRIARELGLVYEPNALLIGYIAENFDTLIVKTKGGSITIGFDAANGLEERLETLRAVFRVSQRVAP